MKSLQILSAISTPTTLSQLTAQFGDGVTAVLYRLERKGVARRYLYDRAESRTKQQRRYVYVWVAMDVPYIPRSTRSPTE